MTPQRNYSNFKTKKEERRQKRGKQEEEQEWPRQRNILSIELKHTNQSPETRVEMEWDSEIRCILTN